MAEEPHERLKRARIERGYQTAAEAVRAFNWNYQTYQGHENGSRGIRPMAARTYARAFGVSPGELLGVAGGVAPANSDLGEVTVVGRCEVGVWFDMALVRTREMHKSIPVLAQGGTEDGVKVAWEVGDQSLRSHRIDVGDFVYTSAISEPVAGAIVVVERANGSLREWSFRKVVERKSGGFGLIPPDADPTKDRGIPYPPGGTSDAIKVLGRVTGAFIDVDG